MTAKLYQVIIRTIFQLLMGEKESASSVKFPDHWPNLFLTYASFILKHTNVPENLAAWL